MNKEQLMQKFRIKVSYTANGSIEQVIREDITGLVIIDIANDKHAYACRLCGAVYHSKNIDTRNLFDTNDPKIPDCNMSHDFNDLIRICECAPIV